MADDHYLKDLDSQLADLDYKIHCNNFEWQLDFQETRSESADHDANLQINFERAGGSYDLL